MKSHLNQSPMSTLKVDFHCSKECPNDVKKKLLEFRGVESIFIDPKQGMVTVIGKVDPMILVKLLEKMGQRAELWSFQKEPTKADTCTHITQQNTHRYHSHRNPNTYGYCSHHDQDSSFSSDSDDGDSIHGYSAKGTNSNIHWNYPNMKGTYGQKSKKKKGWKDWLGFGKYSVEPKFWIKSPRRPINFPAPPPPLTYSPLMMSSPLPGMPISAKPLSSYGYYERWPPRLRGSYIGPSYSNPMIHYRSYADNYYNPF